MQREFFGVADVAALLGVQPVTIYRWCRSGKLTGAKIGKQWYIHRSALERLLPRDALPSLTGRCDEGRSMHEVSPATRSLAARVLRLEAGGRSDTTSLTEAGKRTFERVRPRLTELLGTHGFIALLRRAKYLAQGQFPVLDTLRIDVLDIASLPGLAAFTGANEDESAAALAEFFARFLWLLETFLGQALTVQLLKEVWPELVREDEGSGEQDGATSDV